MSRQLEHAKRRTDQAETTLETERYMFAVKGVDQRIFINVDFLGPNQFGNSESRDKQTADP